MIYFLAHWLFKSIWLNFHIFMNFPVFLILLIYSSISLCLQKKTSMISMTMILFVEDPKDFTIKKKETVRTNKQMQ